MTPSAKPLTLLSAHKIELSTVYRTYELPVNGGTPYEKDVAVEASPTRGCKEKWQTQYILILK